MRMHQRLPRDVQVGIPGIEESRPWPLVTLLWGLLEVLPGWFGHVLRFKKRDDLFRGSKDQNNWTWFAQGGLDHNNR